MCLSIKISLFQYHFYRPWIEKKKIASYVFFIMACFLQHCMDISGEDKFYISVLTILLNLFGLSLYKL